MVPAAGKGVAGRSAEWHRRLLKLRQDQAAGLFALARRSVRCHQASLAYRLALDRLRANPDHEAARRLRLPEVPSDQYDRRPNGTRLTRCGCSAAAWFGTRSWAGSKGPICRLPSGERLFVATWIDAANDATCTPRSKRAGTSKRALWRLRTNHDVRATGGGLGVRLEDLHRLWRQIFLGYYSSESRRRGPLQR